jgi:hypothetical protein
VYSPSAHRDICFFVILAIAGGEGRLNQLIEAPVWTFFIFSSETFLTVRNILILSLQLHLMYNKKPFSQLQYKIIIYDI